MYEIHDSNCDSTYDGDDDGIQSDVMVMENDDQYDNIECVYRGELWKKESGVKDDATTSCSSISSWGESISVILDDDVSFLFDLDPVAEDHDYLGMLPLTVVGYIGSFLNVNDRVSFAMAIRVAYCKENQKQQQNLPLLLPRTSFYLMQEDKLPAESGFSYTLQPFRFLFHFQSCGMLQVDFSLVKHLDDTGGGRNKQGTARQRHCTSSGIPLMIDCFSGFKKLRIVIRKKCPATDNNVVFCMDQSVPETTFHYESNILTRWKPGTLSRLMILCTERIASFPPDGRYYPSTDFLIRSVQEGLREHVHFIMLKQGLLGAGRQTSFC